jgi:PIN domain nuclease of toxin-antitoxin system
VLEPARLRPATVDVITDPATTVFYSAVSLWELATKRAKGKFRFDDEEMLKVIDEQSFAELPVTTRHGLEAAALPAHHVDHFDRMLIAQAQLEGLTLVTSDQLFRHYRVLLMEA